MASLKALTLWLVLATAAVAQPFDTVRRLNSPGYPLSSVCEVIAVNRAGVQSSQGSATLIGVRGRYALLLSCRHVCEDATGYVTCHWLHAGKQVTMGRVYKMQYGYGYESDQALIVCERPKNVWPVRVARFEMMGGPWTSAGFRGGRMYINRHRTAVLKDGLIKVDNPFIGGMSGGSVFNRRGEVVGVVVASDFRSFGVASNGPRLHAMIREFHRQNER